MMPSMIALTKPICQQVEHRRDYYILQNHNGLGDCLGYGIAVPERRRDECTKNGS